MKRILFILLLLPVFAQAQIITTIAGNGTMAHTGDGGCAKAAELSDPFAGTFDKYGNYYFTETVDNRVRKIDTNGIISNFAGSGTGGFFGDGGPATAALLSNVAGITTDTFGNVYISDGWNNRIRKVDVATGIITTIAGGGSSGLGDDGPATAATMIDPFDICFDHFGNLYIADWGNYRVRKINTAGIISTIAGNGSTIFSGEGGPATAAGIWSVYGLCTDTIGNLFIADRSVSRVLKVDTAGILTTIAGTGLGYSTGDGGPATAAQLNPEKVAFDDSGNLYISCIYKYCVRKIDKAGIIHTIAGIDTTAGYGGDGGMADTAKFDDPVGIAFDHHGNLFIADEVNNRIRKITFDTATIVPSTITITASPGDTVCAGTTVTYTTVVTGGITPAYEWYVNGMVTGATGSSYTYTPANLDSVRCVLTSGGPCYGTTVSSNTINMIANPVVIPTISISVSPGDTLCTGTLATFSATITGGGFVPAYKWYVNGIVVSTSGGTYSYTPSNGDSIRCVLTSSSPCAVPVSVTSSDIKMVVNAIVTPTISISASPGDTLCAGTLATFSSVITGGGSSPFYNWYVNGSFTGATSSTYTYIPANGDAVRCVLNSSSPCPSIDTVSSNTINMVVNIYTTPSISLGGINIASIGSTVTVTATVINAGSSYIIEWMNNGVEFITTTAPSVTYIKGPGIDTITAKVVSTATYGCYDSTTSAGHIITLDGSLGVGSLSMGDYIIYPNPVSDVLTIDGLQTTANYRVLSIIGSAIQQGELNKGSNSISVQTLPNGMYLLEVTNIEGQKTITKIVKQ